MPVATMRSLTGPSPRRLMTSPTRTRPELERLAASRRPGRRRRYHRHLPALPRSPGRIFRAAARSRRRRGRYVVLEPLPRGTVRLRELHLRLPVLEGALRGMGVARALRGTTGDRAVPQPRGGPVRPSPPHAARRQGHLGRVRRVVGEVDRRDSDGTEVRAQFLVAATGVLSVPYFPDVPGREDFRGESYHTGLWPATPVDFAGKRSPSSAPDRAACRSSRPSPARSPR